MIKAKNIEFVRMISFFAILSGLTQTLFPQFRPSIFLRGSVCPKNYQSVHTVNYSRGKSPNIVIIRCGICFLACLFTAIVISMRCGHYGCASCVAYLLRTCNTCWECAAPLDAMLFRRLDSLNLDVEVVPDDYLTCGLDPTA